MKEVYFYKFCKDCENEKTPEEKDPCFTCLGIAARKSSHKPINFKEKIEKKSQVRKFRKNSHEKLFL